MLIIDIKRLSQRGGVWVDSNSISMSHTLVLRILKLHCWGATGWSRWRFRLKSSPDASCTLAESLTRERESTPRRHSSLVEGTEIVNEGFGCLSCIQTAGESDSNQISLSNPIFRAACPHRLISKSPNGTWFCSDWAILLWQVVEAEVPSSGTCSVWPHVIATDSCTCCQTIQCIWSRSHRDASVQLPFETTSWRWFQST